MSRQYVIVRWILILSGAFLTCAFAAVFLPVSVMASVHDWLGLNQFPDGAITPYLARSTSVLYGAHGVLMAYTGWTIRRHWRYVPIFGWLHIVIGITLLITDILAPLPLYWIVAEGGPIAALGALILWLARNGEIADRSEQTA